MTECSCDEVCELGYWPDQFQGATRELMVFTKSAKRYFDLDAVREPHKPHGGNYRSSSKSGKQGYSGFSRDVPHRVENPSGAPPLDWWQIPSPKPQPISPYEGPPMTATMYIGDVLDVLAKLPENSVDLVLSSPPFLALRSYLPADHPLKEKEGGSQSTPGEYIDWLLDVVEACDRVLAPHGSLCFELGDTYSGASGWQSAGPDLWSGGDPDEFSERKDWRARPDKVSGAGWPLPKSLSLIPESFRFAMVYGFNPFTGRQTERWRLRNVIRWVRPNPPVGALGDKFRPATSELMVFCKSAKRFFDLDAVRIEHIPENVARWGAGNYYGSSEKGAGNQTKSKHGGEHKIVRANPAGSPPLDWWNIPPGGYEGAHYAVWPPELLIKPIKAMCPEQVCRTCGEPQRRLTETVYVEVPNRPLRPDDARRYGSIDGKRHNDHRATKQDTLGFTDCGHSDYRPGLVLDCFGGSGTTAAVATGHGRDCILIDLDERNYGLALERVGPLVLQRGEQRATSPL